jgi:3-hydroxyisobutyrate dehydrogenase-like beta-hydroxyacid dehydrogenase
VTLAVAVLGLGEAGGTIASGLAAAGCAVRAFDPAVAAPPTGVEPAVGAARAASDAELVLSLTTAAHAVAAAESVAPALGPGQVYADLNTTAPGLKVEVAAMVGPTGAAFADGSA